ncbi:SIS domain-containing protein [Mesorhizobium denitrificans]|uniref:SIS domain-containing protein n=2 Tax=Phyllobacteriaceae TaxID=69277 RepID=A0A371XKC4_9HYPH|nr:SIS domain-containing protein [Mesorhizobium denitrificans]
MRREVLEIPQAVARLLDHSAKDMQRAGEELRAVDPRVLVSVARGSSDHAASFLQYAIELTAGIPVASLGPSIGSIYGAKLKLKDAACLAISQSGKSPDIVAMAKTAREGGALTIALTNTPGSPLAEVSNHAIDIAAGPELSVAATKTFVNSAVAGLAILAHWTKNDGLLSALHALPQYLENAIACDWSPFAEAVGNENSLFVLGRGPSLAIANEVALKFKETCSIHAEAYSAAEVMHGPLALVGPGFPVLVLASRDKSEDAVAQSADGLATRQAAVFATSAKVKAANRLPFAATGHWLTDPLALVTSFYSFIEAFALRRGLNPDQPRNLRKVTETL